MHTHVHTLAHALTCAHTAHQRLDGAHDRRRAEHVGGHAGDGVLHKELVRIVQDEHLRCRQQHVHVRVCVHVS